MLASPEYIALSIKLGQFELFRNFKIGAHLVRGYADLGNEEFIVLGAGKLISVSTGTASLLPEEHEKFFYKIPTICEITDIILRKNFDIKEVSFEDQRTWKVLVEHIESKQQIKAEHKEFECALANLLLRVMDE